MLSKLFLEIFELASLSYPHTDRKGCTSADRNRKNVQSFHRRRKLQGTSNIIIVGNEVIEGTFGEIIALYLSLNLSNTNNYLRERKAW